MSGILPYASLSGYCYESLISYRNQKFDPEGKPVKLNEKGEHSLLRKIVTELIFIPLALLGTIEGIARLVPSIFSLPLWWALGNDDSDNTNCFNYFAGLTFYGGLISFGVMAGSGVGLVQNFGEDRLIGNIETITQTYFWCCSDS